MKIYTKKGDQGNTQLLGGKKVPKHHQRIDAYGTVDELNSYVGLLRDVIEDKSTTSILLEIQDRLFTMGALLAYDDVKNKMNLPQISESDVELLETEIDAMNDTLPPMRSFVLPGGHTTVSFCHITRCICRRAERLTTQLDQNILQRDLILKYLNRLSDYFFVLSRALSNRLNANEIPWTPKS